MWLSVLFAVFLSGHLSVEGGLLYASAPQNRGQFFRGQSGLYNYGYNTGDGIAKVEVKREDGSVVGSYRYFDPNGKQIVRSYIADSNGFRILGNDLPIAPETPAAAIIGAPALTASVEGAHQKIVESAQNPSKVYNTVDIRNIAAPATYRSYDPYQTRSEASTFSTSEDVISNDNYYYYPYQYNYEFPAGFAYPTLLTVPRPVPTIVGAARSQAPEINSISVGGTKSKDYRRTPFSVEGRRYRPVVIRPPFTVGRA